MRRLRPHDLRTALGGVIAALVVLWLAVWLAQPLPNAFRTAALDVGWAAVCLAAGGGAIAMAYARGNRALRRSFVLTGLGILAWGAGQVAWTYYDTTREVPPYPSIADVLYAVSLPLLAAAILAWPAERRRFSRAHAFDAALLGAAVLVCGTVLVIVPLLDRDPFDVVGLLYPAGDILLVAAATVALAYRGFAERGRLFLSSIALLVLVAADTAYAYDPVDDYTTGAALYDPGWTVAFALLGVATLLRPGALARFHAPERLVPVLVVVLLAAAGAYQIVDALARGDANHVVSVALTDALLFVLAIRQMMLATSHAREARELASLTRRLEREANLRRATLEASRTGVCVLDGSGATAFANPAWHALGEDAFAAVADEVLLGQAPVRVERAGRVLLLRAERLRDGETVLSVDDVTQDERERSTRDRFLAEVVRAQDLEARRIAELLHDDAVQQLTALSLRLELASMRSEDSTLAELSTAASGITASLRRLLVDLQPAVLESQGLAAAVETAAESVRLLGVEVVVHPFEHRIQPDLEQLAYRLVQEAMANVIKHAEARHVEVTLELDDGVLRCHVDDDGVGTSDEDVSGALRSGSVGLLLVRERVELAGGRFAVRRRDEGGTRFAFELPVHADARPRAREGVAA